MAGSTRTPGTGGLTASPSAVVSCWMCGIRLNQDQMVPDGSTACNDVRWYCQDSEACTERWTSPGRQVPAAGVAPPGAVLLTPPADAAVSFPGQGYVPAAVRAASSSWSR
jgi:hypothetical protein